MGLLSATTSITRYKVLGELKAPVIDTVANGLKENIISEGNKDLSESQTGWTSLKTPFQPNFEGSSFVVGSYFVFSLCIEKKSISPKTIKKHCAIEESKRLAENGREFLSRQEKKMIKDHVTDVLRMRIPATPNIYDIVWSYEDATLWFCATLKSANEILESLFLKSFKIPLVRLFPYTMADLGSCLSNAEKDTLQGLSATSLLE
jgi:hypothetical protein